ncbi:unnamed protein product, partial [Laminaria digitata]
MKKECVTASAAEALRKENIPRKTIGLILYNMVGVLDGLLPNASAVKSHIIATVVVSASRLPNQLSGTLPDASHLPHPTCIVSFLLSLVQPHPHARSMIPNTYIPIPYSYPITPPIYILRFNK